MVSYLISGASRGLGLALAERLSQKSGNVVIAGARNPSSAKDLQALVERSKGSVEIVELDTTKQDSVDAAIAQIEKKHGSLDILINNAGHSKGMESASKIDPAAFAECYDVNVVGVVRLTQAALPLLRKGSRKEIYTTSSIMGSAGTATKMGMSMATAYSCSKAAATFYTVSLAAEIKPEGFIVQPYHPGWVKTDMGGENGDITIDESVTGIVKLLNGMTKETPVALHSYDESVLPF